jgi:hypothetical protein
MGIEGGRQTIEGKEYRHTAASFWETYLAVWGLFLAVALLAISGDWAGWWPFGEQRGRPVAYVVFGWIGTCATVLAVGAAVACYIMRERNARVIVGYAGVTLRDWRKRERLIPWDTVAGMRWGHQHGKQARGCVDLEVLDDGGAARRERIAGYLGRLPGHIIELRRDIIDRAGLAQVEAHEPGWRSAIEYVIWRRGSE